MPCEAGVHYPNSDGRVWFGDIDVRRSDDAWRLRERLQRETDVDGDGRVREHGDGQPDDHGG